VVYVSAATGSTASMLSQSVGHFLHVPLPTRNATKWLLTTPVLDALAAARTELLLLDDLHMIEDIRKGGQEMNDHLKSLANHAAVTILGAGILLERSNLFADGRPPPPETDASGRPQRGRAAQFGARVSDLQQIGPYGRSTKAERETWIKLVAHFEDNLILLDHEPHSLARYHGKYLHDRTGGYIGSLTSLIKQGAHNAVLDHHERLDPGHLDQVVLGRDPEAEYKSTTNRTRPAKTRAPRARAG